MKSRAIAPLTAISLALLAGCAAAPKLTTGATGVTHWENPHFEPSLNCPAPLGPWATPVDACIYHLCPSNYRDTTPRPGEPGDFDCWCHSFPGVCAIARGICPPGRSVFNSAYCHTHPETGDFACRADAAGLCPLLGVDPLKNAGPCQASTNPGTSRGNPINIATGNKYEIVTDVEPFDGLQFTRYYNSDGLTRPRQSFRDGWRGTYDRAVMFAPGAQVETATVYRHDGRGYYFTRNGSQWLSDPDVTLSLQRLGNGDDDDGWRLVDEDDSVELYDSKGRLTEISRRGLLIARITHDTSDRVVRVDARSGRSLSFAYDPGTGQLQTVSTPLGVQASYAYDAHGQLERVTYADATGRRYHYEATDLTLLTGTSVFTPKDEVRTATWAYDGTGRAILSVRGIASAHDDRVEVEYPASPPDTRVVRRFTAPGAYTAETAQVALSLGVMRVVASTQACADCGAGSALSRTFDSNGFLDQETDAQGTVTDHDFDARGLELRRIDAASTAGGTVLPSKRTVETDWHATHRQPVERRVRNHDGVVESLQRWSYDARGQELARCSLDPGSSDACLPTGAPPPDVRRTTTTYCDEADAVTPGGTCPIQGLVKSIDGPRTDVADTTALAYYAESDESGCSTGGTCRRVGDLAATTNALGQTTQFLRYDAAGRLLRQVDPNGVPTDFEYSPRGWVSARKVRGSDDLSEADDAITRFEYDAQGQVSKVIGPGGDYQLYTHDAAQRLTIVTDRVGNTIEYTYDAAGGRIREESKDPAGAVRRVLARQFDGLGRLAATIHAPYAMAPDLDDPSVKKTVYTYDANGNLGAVTDPLAHITDHDYDARNRLVRTTGDVGGIGAVVAYAYDANDRLRQVLDPKGLATRYDYDGLGNLRQLVSPDTGTTEYAYDQAGNRTAQTDARGITATFGYDPLDRLTLLSYPNVQYGTTFAYDTIPSRCAAKEQYGIGRLSAMHDAWGSTWYCYDRFGNVARRVQQRERRTWEVSYNHDPGNRLVEIGYPAGGPSVRYERDLVGRIIAVNVGKDVLVSGAGYLPFGPLERIAFGHGDELVRHYDQNAWSTGVQSPALALGYRLDDVGNIVALGTSPGAPQAIETYDYDGLYRLMGVRAPDGSVREGYTYDATGNRTTHAVAQQTVDYTYAANSHRLMAVGDVARGYDANGNTTSIGSQTLVYGDHNRLVDATHAGGATASEYNGRGERVRHGTANTVYDEGGRVLLVEEEIDSCPWCKEVAQAVPATRQWLVWLDDTPVGLATDDGLYAVHADQLDTPRAVTTRTAPAQERWHWPYEGNPFGAAAANEDPDGDGTLLAYPLRFPGQVADADTGLHYNYFRDYEPATGRYVESDPIGLVGGLSTFGYVGSNPLLRVDPLGLDWQSGFVLGCGIGGGIGSTVGGPLGAAAGGATGLACGPGAPVCSTAGAIGGYALGAATLGFMGCMAGGALGAVVGMCTEAVDCKKARQDCRDRCWKILEQPRRGDANTWDFHKCVNECLEEKGCL